MSYKYAKFEENPCVGTDESTPYIHFWLSNTWTVVTDGINDLLETFPNTVHILLNISPQIEKIVLQYNK